MNKLPEICKNPAELNRLVQVMLEFALEEIIKKGVNPLVVETYRPQERQNYLYCQGRTITECTAKGISQSFAASYCNPNGGKRPTKTLNSVHKSRKAVDVVPQRIVKGKMKAIWSVKDPETQIIIKTMQKYGFESGANWTNFVDSPHYQVSGNFTNVFDASHTTPYVTKAIQKALNKMECNNLTVDGKWGPATTEAVNVFLRFKGYKTINGQLGTEALGVLLFLLK